MSPARFDCASSGLMPHELLRRMRSKLGTPLLLAIAAHLGLNWIPAGFQTEQRVPKPLTTQFVKRQPRLTKPLELKKVPQPRRRSVQRRMVAVQARAGQRRTARGVQAAQIAGSLSRPKLDFARAASAAPGDLEPQAVAGIIEGQFESRRIVDVSLEMVDITALDTGKFQAMVIQDPTDKRSVRGFFHLSVVYCRSYLAVYVYDRKRYLRNLGVCIRRLSDSMNRHTLIRTDVAPHKYLDTSEIFEVPWVFLSTYNSFRANEAEAGNVGRYLTAGGFLFADFVDHVYVRADASLRDLFKRALGGEGHVYGRSWSFETLPNSHAIYHCFFDFDGPPEGRGMHVIDPQRALYSRAERRVDGVTVWGRLLGVVSTKSYANAWGDWGPGGAQSGYINLDPTRCLQFGVNSIVFALTQEGSITSQVMDTVNY